jgi:NADPH:quinone reductase-like Zn-dependent oxidoreductase
LAGLTAWQGLLRYGELKAGQRVLIHGGSGGVGHFAIQFAKAKGAHVITTVSQPKISKVFDFHEVGSAFEYVEKSDTEGKVVLKVAV